MSDTPQTATPLDVLGRLTQLDKLMLISTGGGVTHERIGKLDSVSLDGDRVRATGPDHDAMITVAAISAMEFDRDRNVGEKQYPRVNFLGADGKALFSAISFVGLEPFEAALAGLDLPSPASEPAPFSLQQAENDLTDPGQLALEALATLDSPVTVRVERAGYVQNWTGRVESILARRGFINIIIPNFHFHLRTGTVAGWKHDMEAKQLVATNEAGQPLGLSIIFDDIESLAKVLDTLQPKAEA